MANKLPPPDIPSLGMSALPLLAVLLWANWQHQGHVSPVVLGISTGLCLLIGAAIYPAVRKRMKPSLPISAIIGAIVGGLPWFILFSAMTFADGSSALSKFETYYLLVGISTCGMIGGVMLWSYALDRTDHPGSGGS